MKILVVDDYEQNQRIIVKFLEKLGYTDVQAVDNAPEALYMYLVDHYDLVFLDILMPRFSGIDFLDMVTTMHQSGRLAKRSNIVVATALNDTAQLKNLASYECVHTVLRKPLKKESLAWLLEEGQHQFVAS